MKKKRLFYFFLVFFLKINLTFASDKIFFIDIDFIINNSNYSKKIFDELKNEIDKINETLKVEENDLIDEDKKLAQKKNILNNEEFITQANELREKIKNYNLKKEQLAKQISKINQEKIILILDKINPIIEKYVNENKIDMIINKNSIYISNNKFDITNEILKNINMEIK